MKIQTYVWVLCLLYIFLSFPTFAFAAPADLDSTFNSSSGIDGQIVHTAVDSSDHIIIYGYFSTYDSLNFSGLARIDKDGLIDSSFDPGTSADGTVEALAVQSDRKVIIAGDFETFDGDSIIDIARLNADGSLDSSFDPGLGSDGIIYDIIVLQSGKILVAGQFSSFNSISANNIVLLNQDGSVDTTFDVATGPDSSVYALLEQPDGKIVIGGNFTTFNAQSRQYLARIESDGSLDTSFIVGSSIEFPVYSLALQSTNNIIFVGLFYNDSGVEDIQIGRLLADTGTLDSSFNPGGVATDPGYWSNTVSIEALKVLDTDQILIGGQFREYNLVTRNGIARLQADGTLDTVFDPGTGVDYSVKSISLLSNNQIIIAGNYYTYNDTASVSISKLEGNPVVEEGVDENNNETNNGGSGSDTSSSSSDLSTPVCLDPIPESVPKLFQVDVSSSQAILYFTPVNTNAPNYMVSYSQFINAFQHGVFTNQGYSSGALVYTINHLQPNTTYYIKIRGQNGCAPSEWGNQIKITTAKKGIEFCPVYAFKPLKLF